MQSGKALPRFRRHRNAPPGTFNPISVPCPAKPCNIPQYQRRRRAEGKRLQRAQVPFREHRKLCRQQWPMNHTTAISRVSRIFRIIVDAVSIETQRRKAKQGRRVQLQRAPLIRFSRFNRPLRGRTRLLTIHNVLIFAQNQRTARKNLMSQRNEIKLTAAPRLPRHPDSARHLL